MYERQSCFFKVLPIHGTGMVLSLFPIQSCWHSHREIFSAEEEMAEINLPLVSLGLYLYSFASLGDFEISTNSATMEVGILSRECITRASSRHGPSRSDLLFPLLVVAQPLASTVLVVIILGNL